MHWYTGQFIDHDTQIINKFYDDKSINKEDYEYLLGLAEECIVATNACEEVTHTIMVKLTDTYHCERRYHGVDHAGLLFGIGDLLSNEDESTIEKMLNARIAARNRLRKATEEALKKNNIKMDE